MADYVISDDDLKLLATPDSEIIKACQDFCFDYEKFTTRIETGERWHQLMQCHLHFEHVIDHMLREALPFPDEISFGRMGFRQRLDLVRALDLLPISLVSPIKRITKMRNDVAHKLDFEIVDQAVEDLKNSIPVKLRDAILADEKRSLPQIEFFELLSVVLVQTEIIRQSQAARRILAKKGEIRLKTVLQKTPGAVYVP